VDLTLADESYDVAKPLTVALRELGPCTDPVVRILVEAGADVKVEQYEGSPICRDVTTDVLRGQCASPIEKFSQVL